MEKHWSSNKSLAVGRSLGSTVQARLIKASTMSISPSGISSTGGELLAICKHTFNQGLGINQFLADNYLANTSDKKKILSHEQVGISCQFDGEKCIRPLNGMTTGFYATICHTLFLNLRSPQLSNAQEDIMESSVLEIANLISFAFCLI